jgi:hypothetical protein
VHKKQFIAEFLFLLLVANLFPEVDHGLGLAFFLKLRKNRDLNLKAKKKVQYSKGARDSIDRDTKTEDGPTEDRVP